MSQSGMSPSLVNVLGPLVQEHGAANKIELIVGGTRYHFPDGYIANLDDNGQDVVDTTNYEPERQNFDDMTEEQALFEHTQLSQELDQESEPVQSFDPVVLRMQSPEFLAAIGNQHFALNDPLINAQRIARWLETGEDPQEAGQEATGSPETAEQDDPAQDPTPEAEAVSEAPEASEQG